MKNKSKSPLKNKPLRYVAQSADEAIEDLLGDKMFTYFIAAWVSAVVLGFEWFRYYRPIDQPPLLLSIIFAAVAVFSATKVAFHYRKLKNLKQGRDGERAVGQYLELFRQSGCHVYHDILGKGFNIDHVVISTKGVFVVETKTYSKPASGKASITFDGKKLLINGLEPLNDIIIQAKAASSYIKGILQESTGKEFKTFPVVLFPGWYVDGVGNRQGKMWVLEPKAFRKFLETQPVKLTPEDVNLASYHLSRHIRTS